MTRRGAVVKVGEKVVVAMLGEERGGGRAAEKEMDDEAWAGPTAKEVIVVEALLLLLLLVAVVGGAARCRLAREEVMVGAGVGEKGGGRSGAVVDGAAARTPLMSDITGAARPALPTARWLAVLLAAAHIHK